MKISLGKLQSIVAVRASPLKRGVRYVLGIGSRLLDLCQGLRERLVLTEGRGAGVRLREEVEGWHVDKANMRGRRRPAFR